MHLHKCKLKILKKKYQEKWENVNVKMQEVPGPWSPAHTGLFHLPDPTLLCLQNLWKVSGSPWPNCGSSTFSSDLLWKTVSSICLKNYWNVCSYKIKRLKYNCFHVSQVLRGLKWHWNAPQVMQLWHTQMTLKWIEVLSVVICLISHIGTEVEWAK